ATNITGPITLTRHNAFLLKEGVKVYGGFPSGGGSWDSRNPATHLTILNGESNPGGLDDNNDANNFHHVVLAIGTSDSPLSANTVLDGFTIIGGRADDRSHYILVKGQQVNTDEGGGVYNIYSNAVFANLVISGNSSSFYGGGVANYNSSPSLA